MCAFHRDDNQRLCVDGLSLADITASYGSPLYVYSGSGITEAFTQFQAAVAPVSGKVHFAMKANSALGVLALIGRLGGGMDIVSLGELARAQAAGGQRMKENARVVVAFIHVRAGQGALGRALTPVPAL